MTEKFHQRAILFRVSMKTYKRICALAKKQAMAKQTHRSLAALSKDAVMEYLEKEEAK